MDENVDDKKIAQREYERRYRENNAERIKENQRRYREKHKAEIAERRREGRLEDIDEYLVKEQENREKYRDVRNARLAERKRKERQEDPEGARARDRENYAKYQGRYQEYKRRYYQENKERIGAANKANYQAKKDEYAERSRRYRESNMARTMRNAARRRCEKLGLSFDLTIEYIESLIPEVCPVLGIPLEVGVGTAQPGSPSLDRIVPELGYVQGNVQVISNKANMMKQDASWNDLRKFSAWVRDNASE